MERGSDQSIVVTKYYVVVFFIEKISDLKIVVTKIKVVVTKNSSHQIIFRIVTKKR